MFNGFHHIGLAVTDTERSVAFYTAIGGKVTCSFPFGDKRIYMVDLGGNAVLEILPFLRDDSAQQSPRFAHIALMCDDVDAEFKKHVAAGAKVKSEPNDLTLESEPPVYARNAFLIGPDGEDIELFCVK